METADYNGYLPAGWQLADDFFATEVATSSALVRDVGTFEYDAVIALGLMACAAVPEGPLPDGFGTLIWDQIANLSFDGLTGSVRRRTPRALGA